MADSTPRSDAPAPVAKKMEELRLKCENQVEDQLHRIEEFTNSFHKSMESVLQRTQETVANQVELGKLKAKLREEEDALVKAIAEKTRKEARKLMLTDSVSSSRARGDKLDRILQDHRARKDKCSAVIAQQCRDLLVEEEKRSENSEAGQIQEAISWYNRALGFRIDCGHGIKFTFTNIHPKNPNQEFSFTIHHSNDTYTVLQCEPHLNGIEPLVQDLNKTNGLFKFVRTLRELFLEAVASGVVPQHASSPQEASVISNPFSLMSSDTKSESQTEESDIVLKIGKVKRVSKSFIKEVVKKQSSLQVLHHCLGVPLVLSIPMVQELKLDRRYKQMLDLLAFLVYLHTESQHVSQIFPAWEADPRYYRMCPFPCCITWRTGKCSFCKLPTEC